MIVFLIRAIVFPLAWLWAMGIAKKHEDTDSKARMKVGAAIVAGVVLTAGIGYLLYDFQEDARTGMYERMNDSLKQVTGAAAYEEQGKAIVSKGNQIDILSGQRVVAQTSLDAYLAAGNITGYEETLGNLVVFETNLGLAQMDLAWASTYQARLGQEDAFFRSLQPAVKAQDDDAILQATAQREVAKAAPADLAGALLDAEKELQKQAVALNEARVTVMHYELLDDARPLTADEQTMYEAAQAEHSDVAQKHAEAEAAAAQALAAAQAARFELPVPTSVMPFEKLTERVEQHMGIKTKAEADMMDWMVYLLYPGLIGVFYAPLFFALGSIMANAWEPSESIGYKKYPAGALAYFLFFGAFGWPSLLFSAWGFWDIDVRSKEGQIAL